MQLIDLSAHILKISNSNVCFLRNSCKKKILACSYSPSGILRQVPERGSFQQVCLMTEWKQALWLYRIFCQGYVNAKFLSSNHMSTHSPQLLWF